MFFWFVLLSLFVSYLLGSLNFSIIISKNFNQKKDVREVGSNNAGFSNMIRTFGVVPALFTFAGDFSKGILSIFISNFVLSHFQIFNDNRLFFLTLSCLSCCLGHIWPCFFNFHGGKAILTAWACIFLIDFKISLFLILVFLIVLILFKIVSLASICATISYPFLVFVFEKENFLPAFVVSLILSGLVIFKHRSNIKRLIKKEENTIEIHKK